MRVLPGLEGIYVRIQRKATPYSAGEGLDPIQLRMSEGLVGVHHSDDKRYLEVESELVDSTELDSKYIPI